MFSNKIIFKGFKKFLKNFVLNTFYSGLILSDVGEFLLIRTIPGMIFPYADSSLAIQVSANVHKGNFTVASVEIFTSLRSIPVIASNMARFKAFIVPVLPFHKIPMVLPQNSCLRIITDERA